MTGRAATTTLIRGRAALSVGLPEEDAPAGWAWTSLYDVAELGTGHTPRRSVPSYWDGEVPWIGIRDAAQHHGGRIATTQQTITEAGLENSSARLLPAGTVCLSRTASVGYVIQMDRPMATSQDFVTWTCVEEGLDPRFLMHALLAEGDDIRRFGKGTTHTTIYFPEVKAFHISLPPLAEQRRIVAKLDALTARTARTRADLDRIPALAARYKQAALAKAFSGELTTEWRREHADVAVVASEVDLLQKRRAAYQDRRRGSRLRDVPSLLLPGQSADLPPTWALGCVADVADLRVGFAFKSGWFNDTGVPLIRGANVGVGALDCDDLKRLALEQARDFDAYRLEVGDIVLAMDRPIISAGLKIARVGAAEAGALLVQRVASPVTTPLIDMDFLWWLFHSQHYLGQIGRHATGSDLPHVSGNDILTTSAPLPPLPEQREIARRIARSMAEIDRMVTEAAAARRLLDRLDQSILAKAFRGELVPQDSADEPANALLDRIRVERASAPKAHRRRRKAVA